MNEDDEDEAFVVAVVMVVELGVDIGVRMPTIPLSSKWAVDCWLFASVSASVP